MGSDWEKFKGLLGLAYEQSECALFHLLYAFIGMIAYMVLAATYTLREYISYGEGITAHVFAAGDNEVVSAILMSGLHGAANAFNVISFFITIAGLLIYAVAFVHICYIYDNRSWELFNFPDRVIRGFFKTIRVAGERDRRDYNKYLSWLEGKVYTIRDKDTGYNMITED